MYTTNIKSYIGYFGDVRLQNRGIQFFQKICHNLTINIKKLSDGDKYMELGFHRFLENRAVTKQEIETVIANHTNTNCKGIEKVLIINDTTEVAFPTQKNKKEDFGPTGYFDYNGFFVHPNIVVNPITEEILGLAGSEIWIREHEKIAKNRAKKVIEEKESFKWINSLINGSKYITNAAIKTFVTDRESDIYEYMHHVIKNNNFFILRSSHNRKLDNNADKKIRSVISEHIANHEIILGYSIDLHETRKRAPRVANLNLKYGSMTILRPDKIKNKANYPVKMDIYFVSVEEDISTSLNEKNKVSWRLLTNHKITSVIEAKSIVDQYKLRWTIEPMFGSFKKKGLDIESTQIESLDKLEKLVLLGLNACIKIFYLVKFRNNDTITEAKIIFSPKQIEFIKALQSKLEGRTEKQKNRYQEYSMAWAAWTIAKLGSWNGYDSDRPPGWQTMFDGLQKFNNMFDGWLINA